MQTAGQNELKVKLLKSGAHAPVCAHPGQDLGYDLFAAEDASLNIGVPTLVSTGVAVEMSGHGFLIRDRSSMAAKGIIVSGGVIDAGYRGEVKVILTLLRYLPMGSNIKAGDKIAQLIPIRPETAGAVVLVDDLTSTERAEKGFGSTGK